MITNIIKKNGYCIFDIDGELDANSALTFDNEIQKIIDKGYKKIIFNCLKLEYISSTGIGVFVSYIENSGKEKVNFVLYGLNEKVLNTFQILGINKLLVIKDSREAGEKYLNVF